MTNTTKTETYEVVAGTRVNPGQVLKTFKSTTAYRCGGPATACLRHFDKLSRSGVQAFFRKVH